MTDAPEKRWWLDLTQVPKEKIPKWWGKGPLRIPLRKSATGCCEFDVIEEDLPPRWVARVRARALRESIHLPGFDREKALSRPMGLHRCQFPIQASLVEVKAAP